MTPEEEIIRAEHCNQIMNDKYVREALDSIKAAVVEQWRTAPVKDRDLKEQMWALHNAVYKFEELLKSHIETGKLARMTDEQKGWREKFRLV